MEKKKQRKSELWSQEKQPNASYVTCTTKFRMINQNK